MNKSTKLNKLLSTLPSQTYQILLDTVEKQTITIFNQGLLAPCRLTDQPLLLLILEAFYPEITQSKINSYKISIQQLMDSVPDSKFLTRPRWQDSPVNAWLFALLSLPGGQLVAPFVHSNVLHLVRDCWQITPNLAKLRSVVQGAVTPLLSLTRSLTSDQIIELSQYLNSASMLAFFITLLSNKFSPTSQRYKEYRSKLVRLFKNELPKYGGTRKGGAYGPRSNNSTYENLYSDPYAYEEFFQNNPIRKAFHQEANRYEQELNPTKDQNKHHYTEPFPNTQFVNPTPNTPGVPSLVEIGVMLNGCSSLPPRRAARARLFLLAAVGVGWTKQIQNSYYADQPPFPEDHPGLVFLPDGKVNISPRVTVGRPEWYDADSDRYTQFTKCHTPSQDNYTIPLHPALATYVKDAVQYNQDGMLFPDRSYQQAIANLNTILNNTCPGVLKITPGRLSLLFQGLTNQWGIPWAQRYALCGRPMAVHEMAINYSLISLNDATQTHWEFINHLLEHITKVTSSNLPRIGANTTPKPTNQSSPKTPGHTGSWSTPKLAVIREVISFTQTQQGRTDLPAHEYHNWTIRMAGFSGAILMAMRPYAFENLDISPRQPLNGLSFAQRVKRRHGEVESWIERFVPEIIQSLWWQALSKSAAIPHQGGLPCLLDSNSTPRPFSMQKELDFVLAQIGYIDGNIRAYGLRHLGRTLFANAGLSDTDLALVMNHWGKGFERHNMVRLGADFTDFTKRFELAAIKTAHKIGMDPDQWRLSPTTKKDVL